MHLGFALQTGNALAKSAPVGAYCLPEAIIAIKDCAKSKWQDRSLPEANTYNPCMFENVFFV